MSANTKKQKVKIALIIGVFSLAVLVFALLLLEGTGTFVGLLLNRPVAASYINKMYDGMECDFVKSEIINENVERLGIESRKKAYRFEYIVESYTGKYDGIKSGDRFYIDAYSFGVIEDGLYREYFADRELLDYVNKTLVEEMALSKDIEEAGVVADEVFFDLCIYDGEYEGAVEERFDALLAREKLGDTDCVIHLLGEKVAFDEYKKKVAAVAEFFKEEDEYKPGFLQVVYYYTNGDSRVIQYESRLEFYEIDYEAEYIAKATGMHYIVELNEQQKTKVTAYNVVKYVYLIVVSVTVIGLSAYWVVRKVRKLSKQEVVDDDRS